mmetsp:Transcript_124164/g.356697  ORF Transcript_124164/g.356697 Transcript_124164/m.356697 type:complete len:215 (+) Transcript_124164:294-938(+)
MGQPSPRPTQRLAQSWQIAAWRQGRRHASVCESMHTTQRRCRGGAAARSAARRLHSSSASRCAAMAACSRSTTSAIVGCDAAGAEARESPIGAVINSAARPAQSRTTGSAQVVDVSASSLCAQPPIMTKASAAESPAFDGEPERPGRRASATAFWNIIHKGKGRGPLVCTTASSPPAPSCCADCPSMASNKTTPNANRSEALEGRAPMSRKESR